MFSFCSFSADSAATRATAGLPAPPLATWTQRHEAHVALDDLAHRGFGHPTRCAGAPPTDHADFRTCPSNDAETPPVNGFFVLDP